MAKATEYAGSPSKTLDALAQEPLGVSRKARRSRKNLAGDSFYGNKLAQLRTDATNAFSELSDNSVGDTSALAELIDLSFSASTVPADRVAAVRELSHALRTKWKEVRGPSVTPGNELFPLALITKTQRSYLLVIAKQMNGSFREGWYDACAVMMRRLVENSIIEAFEHLKIEYKIRDTKGDYVQLTELIDRAIAEPKLKLSRNAKKDLPKLRDLGHRSAHGRYFTAQRSDIARVEEGVRVVVEEFLVHADLL